MLVSLKTDAVYVDNIEALLSTVLESGRAMLVHGAMINCYVGSFYKDLPEGQGEYVDKNCNKYVGHWANGAKHGSGTEVRDKL